MSRPSVAQFISDRRAEGHDDSKIIHELLAAGWHIDIIHKAMNTEIKHRGLDPILDINKQPYKRYAVPLLVGLIILILLYLAAFL